MPEVEIKEESWELEKVGDFFFFWFLVFCGFFFFHVVSSQSSQHLTSTF